MNRFNRMNRFNTQKSIEKRNSTSLSYSHFTFFTSMKFKKQDVETFIVSSVLLINRDFRHIFLSFFRFSLCTFDIRLDEVKKSTLLLFNFR